MIMIIINHSIGLLCQMQFVTSYIKVTCYRECVVCLCFLCSDQGIQYLTFRFWIGMWLSFLLLLMVAFDLSALVRYITRFTEESFAILIALIFIFEAFKKLIHILEEDAVNLQPVLGVAVDGNCTCRPPENSSSLSHVTSTLSSLGSCYVFFHSKSLLQFNAF